MYVYERVVYIHEGCKRIHMERDVNMERDLNVHEKRHVYI